MYILSFTEWKRQNESDEKKRGGAPVSEARTQHLRRSNVLCSSRQHHLLWPGLGAMRWMGEAVLVFGWWWTRSEMLIWAEVQPTPKGPPPLIDTIDKDCTFQEKCIGDFDCLLDTILQICFKEIFAWKRTFGLSWRHVTIFHLQVQMHYIQLPKKSAFASLSSFSVLVIHFQLV